MIITDIENIGRVSFWPWERLGFIVNSLLRRTPPEVASRARSIEPKFQPVRPGKLVHLKRWTRFFETFPVGPNRSIEFWTEISGNFGWMDRALSVCLKKGFVQVKAWRKAADQHQVSVCGRTVHLIEVSLRVSYKNVTKHKYLKTYWSIIAPCNAIQENIGFWIPYYGFRIPSINGFRIPCQWNFDSRFQFLAGFRMSELNSGLQKPGSQQVKVSLILESGLPYMRRQPSILK